MLQVKEKRYLASGTSYITDEEGHVIGEDLLDKHRIKARTSLEAIGKVASADLDDVGFVYTPFGKPIARYLSNRGATLEDCLPDTWLSHPDSRISISEGLGDNDVRLGHESVRINGVDIPYHNARIEKMQRGRWVPVEIISRR